MQREVDTFFDLITTFIQSLFSWPKRVSISPLLAKFLLPLTHLFRGSGSIKLNILSSFINTWPSFCSSPIPQQILPLSGTKTNKNRQVSEHSIPWRSLMSKGFTSVVLFKTAPSCSQAFGVQLSSEKGLSFPDPGLSFSRLLLAAQALDARGLQWRKTKLIYFELFWSFWRKIVDFCMPTLRYIIAIREWGGRGGGTTKETR